MIEQHERDFKGVWIPREVWLDTRLNILEKGILVEIDSLDRGENGCFASNKYLAEFCQCGETKVSTAISKLKNLGYIYEESFDGRQRILKSRLSNFERQGFKILKATDIYNINNNNIKENNNRDINSIDQKDTFKTIIDYLNLKAKTNYRASSKPTQSHIKARLNEGFTVEDFKTVIDKKVKEWKRTEFEKFLRPETLFGSKFENYLNSPSTIYANSKTPQFQEREYTDEEMARLIDNVDDIKF